MKHPFVYLLCLLLFRTVHLTVSGQVENAVSQQDAAASSTPGEERFGEPGSFPNAAPGPSDVLNAKEILRTIKPTASRLTRLDKPGGALGTALYYAKQLFVVLFMTKPSTSDTFSSQTQPRKLGRQLQLAVDFLEAGAAKQDVEALMMLADLNLLGNYSYPRNFTEAWRLYDQVATLNGNSTAQHMLGMMYATGLAENIPVDQAKATLYHTFAAKDGDVKSDMTIAYRHHSGIATRRNCEEAVKHYKQVADKAIAFARSGPPGGHAMLKESYRVADDEGGVYGEGASVSSAGFNARPGSPISDAQANFDDVLEYLDLMSRKGDLKATLSLGRLHYDGSKSLKRDFKIARDYFMDVARKHWTKDGKVKSDSPTDGDKLASKAAGFIGRMFLRGEGVEQSFAKAKIWFTRGTVNADSLCQYSLGLMYLHGYGVPRDPVKAADYFAAAADQDMASAQVRLGILFLDQGDIQTASKYFDLGARNGHIEAYYYQAEMINQGVGKDRSCAMATTYYKIVTEKAEALVADFQEANEAYSEGDKETALLEYLMAAEQGFENAQANVAWILDQKRSRWPVQSLLTSGSSKSFELQDAAMALTYWTRSAKQLNIDSLVKMGDYYLEGVGIDSDNEKAAACYQAAAETMQSAQAMWNLGWMHENGIGIEQDFHLAKRMYDQALETNKEAYLPVKLALLKLRFRSWWNKITYGDVNPIQEEPAPNKEWSFSEWINAFLEADAMQYEQQMEHERDDWDAFGEGMPGSDDLYEELEEGFLETVIIVGLAAFLAFLVYYRQQREVNRRRQQQQQQQQQHDEGGDRQDGNQQPQQDRGFFPQPGDPAFNDWVAGGVGH